jgi:hypothetical protein
MRLIVYWVLVSLLLVLPLATSAAVSIGQTYWRVHQQRRYLETAVLSPALSAFVQQSGGLQAYLDRHYRYPPLADVIREQFEYPLSFRGYRRAIDGGIVLPIVLAYLVWPWVTALAMAIFRQTMHQARIGPLHVLRCAIYSADAGILLAFILIPLLHWIDPDTHWAALTFGGRMLHPAILWPLLVCEGVLMYRLMIAYKRYLTLPQAAMTVVASQLVVIMGMLTLYAVLLRR